MGIRHLKQIEKLLQDNPDKFYTARDLRDFLRLNSKSVAEIINYLKEGNQVRSITNKYGNEAYGWNPDVGTPNKKS